MKTKHTNTLQIHKGSVPTKRSRTGTGVRQGGSTQTGRKIQSAATKSLRQQLPNNTPQGKLPRNRDIQLTPNQKSQQVDAEPAFLPLLLLWGLFGRRKKNTTRQLGSGAGGWGGMGGMGGMGSASPWFQNPGANAGGMGQMPVGPMQGQGMGGGYAPTMPWGAGGSPGAGMFGSGMGAGATPGVRGPMGGYPQAPSGPGYPSGMGGGPKFPTWF